MRHPGQRRHDNPWDSAPSYAVEIGYGLAAILEQLTRMENTMATQAQIDKLMADVAALIDAGVAEITAAVAAAQRVPPAQADAAIDALDAKVTAATQSLKDAAASLTPPPAAPPATPAA